MKPKKKTHNKMKNWSDITRATCLHIRICKKDVKEKCTFLFYSATKDLTCKWQYVFCMLARLYYSNNNKNNYHNFCFLQHRRTVSRYWPIYSFTSWFIICTNFIALFAWNDNDKCASEGFNPAQTNYHSSSSNEGLDLGLPSSVRGDAWLR